MPRGRGDEMESFSDMVVPTLVRRFPLKLAPKSGRFHANAKPSLHPDVPGLPSQ